MRKIKISLIMFIIAVLCLSNSACFHVKNAYAESIVLPLIANQSFEVEDTQSAVVKPSDWEVVSANQPVENQLLFVSENAYDGQKYYQLNGGKFTVKTQDFIEINGGERYVFGIKYITSSLENSCAISIQTYDDKNNLLGIISPQVSEHVLLDTWLDKQICFNANENVAKVKMLIQINAENGSVGIDYAYGNKDVINLLFGASISLQEGKTELRFLGRVDKKIYDEYLDKSVSVGVIFMPTNAYKSVGEFTIKGLTSQTGVASFVEKWQNQETAEADGYYEFACAMKNMHKKEALTVSISARAFIKFNDNGKERYIYSTFDIEDNSRSVQTVAKNLKADTKNYLKYDGLQRAIIDAYAIGELPKIAR